MIVEVDPQSALPPYEQIRGQIAAMAAAGVLPVGTRLPTIRQLASDLGLAAGTVARAYRELEADGVVTSRVRHGTTIAPPRRHSERKTAAQLASSARAFALASKQLGVTRDQAVTAFEAQLADLS